ARFFLSLLACCGGVPCSEPAPVGRPYASLPCLPEARNTAPWARMYRPRVEELEQRLPPGDTLLGLWAVGLWGLDLPFGDAPWLTSRADNRDGRYGLVGCLEERGSLRATTLLETTRAKPLGGPTN